jgi:hypothetical protein
MTARPGNVRSDRNRPSGQDLAQQLRSAAKARGMTLAQFIAPLVLSTAENFITQLSRSDRPLPLTVRRVRACIAGEPVPPPRSSPFKGCTGRKRRTDVNHRFTSDELERRRRQTDQAHAERRPGETIHQAIRRLAEADEGEE